LIPAVEVNGTNSPSAAKRAAAWIGLDYSARPGLVERFVAFAEKRGAAVFASHGYVK